MWAGGAFDHVHGAGDWGTGWMVCREGPLVGGHKMDWAPEAAGDGWRGRCARLKKGIQNWRKKLL